MENAATQRAKEVLNWPSRGGKWTQNAKKILLRGNEAKNLLKIKELEFSGVQNEVFLSAQKPNQTQEYGQKSIICGVLSKPGNGRIENGK